MMQLRFQLVFSFALRLLHITDKIRQGLHDMGSALGIIHVNAKVSSPKIDSIFFFIFFLFLLKT